MFLRRLKSNDAFMGATHTSFSCALFFVFISFFFSFFEKITSTNSNLIVFFCFLIILGSSKLPDLDNTTSSAKSALGLVGNILSNISRIISNTIYNMSKSKYDNDTPNPHRGFFHTFLSGILIFLLVYATTLSKKEFDLLGTKMTVSSVVATFWALLSLQIAFPDILNNKRKKQGILSSEAINSIICLFIAGFIVKLASQITLSFSWLAFSVSFGQITHIIGDMFTAMGAPFLFPLPIKGKRWFMLRFIKFKSGGDFEKTYLLPMFSTIAIFFAIRFVYLLI